MAMITIPKDELDQLDKIVHEQAAVIEEQKALIERMGREMILLRGLGVFSRITVSSSAIYYARSTRKIILGIKERGNGAADHELQTLSGIISKTDPDLKAALKDWGDYCRNYPAAAATLQKITILKSQGESSHG